MSALAEKQLYSRNKLLAQLMRIKHPDEKGKKGVKRDNVAKLDFYTSDALAAAKADPELVAHFIAWNDINGRVRDTKVAIPMIALRGVTKKDADLAENAIAHLLKLSPRELVRAHYFSKRLSQQALPISGGFRPMFEKKGIGLYLQKREQNTLWWDKTVVQHRDSMKLLYQISHLKPSLRAQEILFEHKYPRGSVFEKIAKLREMSPKEVAGAILESKIQIPVEVIIGSVAKAKDKNIVLALLEVMTGNQLINYTQMLQKFGVMEDTILKAAYEAALVRAAGDKKVETLKAGRAAELLKGTAVEGKLKNLQQKKVEQLGTIEGDWLVLGDRSGSMRTSIEVARKISSLIAERVAGSVYLVFFDMAPTYFDVTGKSYDEVLEMTRRVGAGGNTSIGCGLDYLLQKGIVVNGIAIASDGGENYNPRFPAVYKKYCEKFSVEPPVYLFHVDGDRDALSKDCDSAGVELTKFELGSDVDYYSIPGIVAGLRAQKYSLFEEIMETKLLRLEDAFERRTA